MIVDRKFVDDSIDEGKWAKNIEKYQSKLYPTLGIRKAIGLIFKNKSFFIRFKKTPPIKDK